MSSERYFENSVGYGDVADGVATITLKMDGKVNRINVNGGAIALGHPLGATGAMLVGTALDELERTGKATAVVTRCIGGGQGVALVLERV